MAVGPNDLRSFNPALDDAAEQAAQFVANDKGIARGQAEEAVAEHVKSEEHARPRGLVDVAFFWDSGVEGTPLTPSSTRPAGYLKPRFPGAIEGWDTDGYPGGTATVVIQTIANGATHAAATTILTVSHSGESSNDGGGFLSITVEEHSKLVAFLTAVATVEQLSVNLRMRRT